MATLPGDKDIKGSPIIRWVPRNERMANVDDWEEDEDERRSWPFKKLWTTPSPFERRRKRQ